MEDLSNKARKIPYGSNILVNCPNCGFKGEPTKHRKGNIILEIILWILFLIPGAVYTARRHINTICKCPKCNQLNLLETDGDNNLIDKLISLKKKETVRLWIIVILFSILGLSVMSGDKGSNISTQKQNYGITNPINNLTDPVKYTQQIDNAVNNTDIQEKEEQRIKDDELTKQLIEESEKEVKEETKIEEPKDPNDEIREKMQGILKEIDRDYGNIESYVGARCYGDCINGIIKIKFRENIGRYDFTVKAHQAGWANKIIRDIPGVFEKIQIDFIYGNQTISTCTFTEYQTNTMVPKGCTYIGYKE